MRYRGSRSVVAAIIWVSAALSIGPRPATAQQHRTDDRRVQLEALSQASTSDALMQMAASAGVIFAGHVISIERNDAAGYVDVLFGIDQPISGCPASNLYGLREWAGLWSGHAPRYVVSRRYLMMLHLPGPAGMSAPVGGVDGAIPLVAAGVGPVMDANGNVAEDTGPGALSGLTVDLRWVQARAIRTRASSAAQAVSAFSNAVGRPVTASVASIGDGTSVTLETVMTVLRGGSSGAR